MQHREEGDDHRERGKNDRPAHFQCGLQDHFEGREWLGAQAVLAQPAMDVFHPHHGIVDDFAQRDRQPPQGKRSDVL